MAVSYVGNGTLAVTTTEVSIEITAPACVAGDLMICFICSRSATTNTILAPTGWTQIAQAFLNHTTSSFNNQYACFWKFAQSSGEAHTFTKATDDNVSFGGIIGVWRGVKPVPLDTTAPDVRDTSLSAQDNVSFGAFDPTSTNVHVVFVAFYSDNSTTFSAAMSGDTNPDCTTRFDEENASGADFTIAVTSGDNDGSSIAARTWASNSVTDAGNSAVVFALVVETSNIKTINGLHRNLIKTFNGLNNASIKTINGLS